MTSLQWLNFLFGQFLYGKLPVVKEPGEIYSCLGVSQDRRRLQEGEEVEEIEEIEEVGEVEDVEEIEEIEIEGEPEVEMVGDDLETELTIEDELDPKITKFLEIVLTEAEPKVISSSGTAF